MKQVTLDDLKPGQVYLHKHYWPKNGEYREQLFIYLKHRKHLLTLYHTITIPNDAILHDSHKDKIFSLSED